MGMKSLSRRFRHNGFTGAVLTIPGSSPRWALLYAPRAPRFGALYGEARRWRHVASGWYARLHRFDCGAQISW